VRPAEKPGLGEERVRVRFGRGGGGRTGRTIASGLAAPGASRYAGRSSASASSSSSSLAAGASPSSARQSGTPPLLS
jgi:hypothetical protein